MTYHCSAIGSASPRRLDGGQFAEVAVAADDTSVGTFIGDAGLQAVSAAMNT